MALCRNLARYPLKKRFYFLGGQNLKEISCGLRDEVIQLNTRSTAITNLPQFVSVKRCKGGCNSPPDFKKCLPTLKEIVDVTVWPQDRKTSYIVQVEQHKACTCNCTFSGDACKAERRQRFNSNRCRCDCAMQRSECKNDEHLDITTCTCVRRNGMRLMRIQAL